MSLGMLKTMMPVLAPLLNKVTNTLDEIGKRYGVEKVKWIIEAAYDEKGEKHAVLKFMHEKSWTAEDGKKRYAILPIKDENGQEVKYGVSEIFSLISGDNSEEDED